MTSHRRDWAFAALAVFVGGCTKSQLDPNANVSVTGTARRPDGSALVSGKTTLVKEPDLAELLSGVVVIGSTLGLACLSDTAPVICQAARTSTTTASGAFSFSLKGSDTQGSVGEASTFDLATQDAAGVGGLSGASTSEQFIINTTALSVPDLRLWEPAVAFSVNGQNAAVTFDALPSSYGTSPSTAIIFHQSNGATVWSQSAKSGDTLDTRLLEDAHGSLVATATATGQATQTNITFDYQSAAIAFAGTAGAAPSRGSPCFIQGTDGGVPLSPCGLTDGDFGTPVPVQTCTGSNCNSATLNGWAYLDRGASAPLSLVVVRGFEGGVFVETSNDASTWATLPGAAQNGIFSVRASGSARYVRVRANTGGSVGGLAEVSVW